MRDTQLDQRIPGLEEPWTVKHVQLNVDEGRVGIRVEHEPGASWSCFQCGRVLGCHDHAEAPVGRHLDTCWYQTHLHARIPRVNCPAHGVKQVDVPRPRPRTAPRPRHSPLFRPEQKPAGTAGGFSGTPEIGLQTNRPATAPRGFRPPTAADAGRSTCRPSRRATASMWPARGR